MRWQASASVPRSFSNSAVPRSAFDSLRRLATVRIDAIVFDCEDAAPLARFWAAALGWQVAPYDARELERLAGKGIEDPEDDPSVMVEPPEDEAPGLPVLFFTEVGEP